MRNDISQYTHLWLIINKIVVLMERILSNMMEAKTALLIRRQTFNMTMAPKNQTELPANCRKQIINRFINQAETHWFLNLHLIGSSRFLSHKCQMLVQCFRPLVKKFNFPSAFDPPINIQLVLFNYLVFSIPIFKLDKQKQTTTKRPLTMHTIYKTIIQIIIIINIQLESFPTVADELNQLLVLIILRKQNSSSYSDMTQGFPFF